MAESTTAKAPSKSTKSDGKSHQQGSKTKLKDTDSADEDCSVSNINIQEEERKDEDDTKQIVKGVDSAFIAINRDEYLQAHRELLSEREKLQIKNNILHRRLSDYYKKRKLVHVLKALEHSMDLEEKFQQKLFSYEELKEKSEREIADINSKVQTVEVQYLGRLKHAEAKFEALQTLERSTGSGLIYSKKGKPIPDRTVERFLTLQRLKQEQSTSLCLRYIRVRNAVSELEDVIKKLEMLGPGLYVYQYEQLNIDNQNYMAKIEEREDELIKNRNKCTEHNQILAHIREKMHHTDEVIDFAECDLGDAQMDFLNAREDLGIIKSRRDKLRWALESEKRKAGLLTRKDLLRDFQDATDELVKLREKKVLLMDQIAAGSKELREARKRIKVVKTPNPAVS